MHIALGLAALAAAQQTAVAAPVPLEIQTLLPDSAEYREAAFNATAELEYSAMALSPGASLRHVGGRVIQTPLSIFHS